MPARPANRATRWLLALGALALLSGGGAPGCADERGAVSRIQPDYLDKSQVVPLQYELVTRQGTPATLTSEMIGREAQWYHQVTIIDKPPTTGARGISSYTQVERIYWEVTENLLIARQAYDRLQGGQDSAGRPPISRNPHQSEILAAYRITSHFDIRRDYNSTTGEEVNILLENITDRPWYLRQYMRVDWSTNLVGNFSPLDGYTAEARAYNNTPNDPNRPVFDYGPMNGEARALRYFDVTNRAILTPASIYLDGYGQIPACYLYDRITESCEPADVTMRVSFRRVDPGRDYQPMVLDGHRMDRFGYFENARQGFNDHLGTPGQNERRHLAERHNLWLWHHARTQGNALDHRDGDAACTTDADCRGVSTTARCDGATRTCGEVFLRCAPSDRNADAETRQTQADARCASVGSGARCDLDVAYNRGDRLGLCLLPFRQRQVRPIAYHLSENYPQRIMPVTNSIISEWNRAFSSAVTEARYRECLIDRSGAAGTGSAAACARWRDTRAEGNRDARHVFVGCHNPVWGTDPNLPGHHTAAEVNATREAGWDTEACGPQGTSARLGDIRYNMLASVNEYDAQGPWGLAGITGDPVTGEVLSGRGAVWQTVTDSQAAFATDMLRILNHDVTADEFSYGRTVLDAYDYVRALGGREERTGSRVPTSPRPVHRDVASAEEVSNILDQTRFEHLRTVAADPSRALTAADLRSMSRDTDGRYTREAFERNLALQLREQLPHTGAAEDPMVRWSRIRGTAMESALVHRESLMGAGLDPATTPATNEAVLDLASPARRNNMAFRAARERWRAQMEAHECRYEAQFSDEVIATMLHRFRRNEVPEDVRFGQTWNFHLDNPAPCAEEVVGPADGAESNCRLNYVEVERYLQQYIHYGVTLHEIGHSVGERHNFAASADAMNYFDRFWQLRVTAGRAPGEGPARADQLRPRWEHMQRGLPYYSPTEEREGVEEYGYSSVMDYKGWNEDAHGLGRYDRAFVLHGYVDLVEAFDNVDDPAEAMGMFEGMSGGYQSSFALVPMRQGTGFAWKTHHYTDIPRVVGVNAQGLPNIGDDNRYPVFLHETSRLPYGAGNWTPDHTNATTANRDGSRAEDPHVLVPYRFNTDNYANYIWNNQRYDAGADMFESMRYVSQRYLDYYFANAFSRGRATFNVSSYRSRMTGRYLDQTYYSMRNMLYITALYENIYAGIAAPTWFDEPAVRGGRLGVSMIVDMFINSLLMPQSSPLGPSRRIHTLRQRVDGTRLWELGGTTGGIEIPVGAGREFSSYFDFGSGAFWRERMTNAGSYHDKQLAMDYLTSTFNWIPGRTVIEFPDVHQFQINLYTAYPAQTLRFFGSLLARDHDDIAPQARARTAEEPEIFRTQFALLNLPHGTGTGRNGRDHGTTTFAIDPNIGFTLELEALTYLGTQLDLTFDRTARTSARLWREGDTWALPATETRTLVTFTNPLTGVTYSAVHVGAGAGELGAQVGLSRRDAATNETGIAARMLIHARRLADAWRAATRPDERLSRQRDMQNYVDLVERVRDLSAMIESPQR